MSKDVNKDTKDTAIFEGVLKSAFTHTDKNEDGSVASCTHVLSVYRDGLLIDGSEKTQDFFDAFYNGKPAKYIPSWYKDGKDSITFKSAYNVPVKIEDSDERFSFDEFVGRGLIRGAKVQIKVNVKEQAIYPAAMKVLVDGEEYDPFADF